MGFENDYTRFIDRTIDRSRDRITHPVLERTHARAQEVLQTGAIKPEDFIDQYGEENVTRDLRYVEQIKTQFEDNASVIPSQVFEAIVLEHTELSDWLGPNAETIRTSEYDDIVNGVDLVLEFNDNHSTNHLALGVDVTFGSFSIQKKFDRIKREIENNKLAEVKYFKTHGYEGSLKQLPRVVIGVDLDKVIALAGLWERKDNKGLEGHITKDILIKEIERQLNTFLIYARSIHSEDAVKSYMRAIHTLRQIHTVRNGFTEDPGRARMIDEDRVYQSIIDNLARFRVTSPK